MQADLNFGEACKLVTVYIHASVAIVEDVTISFISGEDAAYVTVIDANTMTGQKDYVFAAAGDIALNETDSIRVEVSNANETGTVYVEAKAEK